MRYGKLMALVLALLMLAGCGKNQTEQACYEEGLASVAGTAKRCLDAGVQGNLSATSGGRELLQAAGSGDYSVPERVWRVETDFAAYPEVTVTPDLRGQALLATVILPHSMQGGLITSVVGLAQSSQAADIPGLEGAFMYIYQFPAGNAAAVAFNPGSGDAVEVKSMICVADVLDLTSAETLKASLEVSGVTVRVTELELPK